MSSLGATRNDCEAASSVQGHVKVVNVAYVWTIDNCRTLLSDSSSSSTSQRQAVVLRSPVFSYEASSYLKWQLQLHQCGAEVSLYLELVGGPDRVGAKFKFSVFDRAGEQWHKVTGAHVFAENDLTTEIANFVTREQLETLFMPSGALRILCLINTEKREKEEEDEVPKEDEQLKVAGDFKALLNSPAFSDIRFLVFGKEFYAHKCVLAARCPDFLSALMNRIGTDDNYSKVKYNPRYELTDVDPQIMLEILRFVYCGKVENFEDNAFNLLCAVQRYRVDRLRVICEDYLCKNVASETAAYFFMYGSRYNVDRLAKAALKFIVTHRNEVLKTKGYAVMAENHPKLVDEIYRAAALGIKA